MKRIFLWFLLSCKRYLKRIPFLLFLILFPLGAALAARAGQAEDPHIKIAVCSLDPDPESLGSRLKDRLLAHDTGMFVFYECEDAAQVREQVASRKAECGYLLPENLEKKMENGEYKRSVTVLSSPSTVTASLSTEVVFSELAALYNRQVLETYTEQGKAFDALGAPGSLERKKASSLAGELYDTRLQDGSTFHFEYIYGPSGPEEAGADFPEASGSLSFFPVRGLAAVLVFVAGLYSAVTVTEDRRRGLFHPLPASFRLPCQFASLSAPVALAAVSALTAILLSEGLPAENAWTGAVSELLAMTVYAFLTAAFSMALGAVLKTPSALSCALPLFIIGSLVFCPVFFDTEALFPGISQAGRLFLPYYYLQGYFHWL